MTNSVAAALAATIILGLILDRIVWQGAGELFLAIKFVDMVDWLEFWR